MRVPCVVVAIGLLACGSSSPGLAEEAEACAGCSVEQHFPAHEPESKEETRWKICYGYTGRCTNEAKKPAGALYVDEACFRRGPKEPWIRILSDLRLVDIYVAYHGGTRYYDITEFEGSFGPVLASKGDLGPNCVTPGRVIDDYTLLEVHDDGPRWREGSGVACGLHDKERGRRGQRLILWTTFYAANYRYVIEYSFRDDGSITCRLGATAHNISGPLENGGDGHLHTACWRVVPALGDEKAVTVALASTVQNPVDGEAATVLTPVKREAGIVWKAEELTVVRLTSATQKNTRETNAHYIGYDLLLERLGSLRTFGPGEEFTRADVWVTREQGALDPFPNLAVREVPAHADGERLAGQTLALWHMAPMMHASRDEDFDAHDDPTGGVALTMWSTFTLKPRNLFPATPLYAK